MFTDDNETQFISLENTKEHGDREVKDLTVQTAPVHTAEHEAQAVDRMEFGIQTAERSEYVDSEQPLADLNEIANFLARIEPELMQILEENIRTAPVFAHADMLIAQQQSMTTELMYYVGQSNMAADGLVVTSVDWNSSGTLLAVAYGASDHDDWCEHKSTLCVWGTSSRRGFDEKNAMHQLPTTNCVTALRFHPRIPSLVAGGLFTGSVLVWDLNADETDRLVAESGRQGRSRDAISCLEFGQIDVGQSRASTTLQLVSAGLDGRVTVWSLPQIGNGEKVLVPLKNFKVVSEYLPRSVRGNKLTSLDKDVGVTALTLLKNDEDNFVIGTEPGAVFQCTFGSRDTIADYSDASDPEAMLFSPVAFPLKPLKGPVNSACACHHNGSLFAACGGDGTIHVYTVLTAQPVATVDLGSIQPTTHLSFAPFRPTLLMGVNGAKVFIVDLMKSECTAVHSFAIANRDDIVIAGQGRSEAVRPTSIAFNSEKAGLIAVGDIAGGVGVYQLGEGFTSNPTNEDALLKDLLGRRDEN